MICDRQTIFSLYAYERDASENMKPEYVQVGRLVVDGEQRNNLGELMCRHTMALNAAPEYFVHVKTQPVAELLSLFTGHQTARTTLSPRSRDEASK